MKYEEFIEEVQGHAKETSTATGQRGTWSQQTRKEYGYYDRAIQEERDLRRASTRAQESRQIAAESQSSSKKSDSPGGDDKERGLGGHDGRRGAPERQRLERAQAPQGFQAA